jgi:UDP-arabinose 4-epimerase
MSIAAGPALKYRTTRATGGSGARTLDSILVAGGAGYVGSHACKALAEAGYQPVALDDLSTGHADAVKWGPLVVGDIADAEIVRRTAREHRITAVMHFAARSLVGESVTRPEIYYENNVIGTLRLIEALTAEGLERFVFSSSAAVYGLAADALIAEDAPKAPINPYGETKLAVERALSWIAPAKGFAWCALRYFNAAGADADGEIGERHEPETHLIPNLVKATLGLAPPLKLFGDDYPTPDGTPIRDYIHVTDLAEAHVKALDWLKGGESRAFNLGTGQGLSVLEMLAAAERALGEKPPYEVAPRRPGDPPRLVADPAAAMRAFGWTPTRSSADAMVSSVAAFERARATGNF